MTRAIPGQRKHAEPIELTACPPWCRTHDYGWTAPGDKTPHLGAVLAEVAQPDMGIRLNLSQAAKGSPKVHVNVIVSIERGCSLLETQMDYMLPVETARALASDLHELLEEVGPSA